MKSLFLLVTSPLLFGYSYCQSSTAGEKLNVLSDSVSTSANHDPEFSGGDEALATFIKENLITPPETHGCGGDMYAKVVVRFMVGVDGSINNITIIDSAGPLYNQEALLLVQSLPQFKPAYKDGKPVKAYFKLPVVFGAHRKKTDLGY
jgi:TonB family protein